MALPLLQLGVSSEFVPQLRAKLAQLGFQITAPTTEPTVFDSAVQSAVAAFQAKMGLTADGVVGPLTWAKLGADGGAGPGVPVATAGPSWLKLAFMAAAVGGLWWWWKQRRPTSEFSRRRLSGYGDAVDTSLIEEPLLLMERGDCNGAARLLMKRRTYVAGASTPKNNQIFKDVARRVVAHCGREVEPLVREAMKAQEREARYPNVMTDLEQKMRAKRMMVRRVRPSTDLRPWLESQPTIRRGLRPIDTEPQRYIQRSRPTLYPDVRGSRGGRVIFEQGGREVIGKTVGRDNPDSSYVLVEAGGQRQNVLKTRIKRFLPRWGPKRPDDRAPSKEKSASQRAAEAERSKANRAKAAALRAEAKRLELEAMRRVDPHSLRTSTAAQRALWAKRGRK